MAALTCGGVARADFINDVTVTATAPFNTYQVLFPNWVAAPLMELALDECDDAVCTWCTTSNLTGVTIMNYGTATGSDLTRMFFEINCGKTSLVQTLTYAGVWAAKPAWTWAGTLALPDACANCACSIALDVYGDVAPCPVDGRTIQLGPGYNAILNPAAPGGITDNCNGIGPWVVAPDPAIKEIRYDIKVADKTTAAPGDTITYTIYYGAPGTVALTGVTVLDTLPTFMHYVSGSGVPAPDLAWDPDWGPPIRLRWSLAAPSIVGGPTGSVRFQTTVDWGNGEAFEPGSGDVAAPEGAALADRATVGFGGTTCAPGAVITQPATTTVQRFLYWMLGDNDLLFSQGLGQPPDEMIYSIVIKNLSASKTWWGVDIWDTVPPELDPWCVNCGFDDPCTGWTMTPSGCAAATPGRVVAGATTLLTWNLDLPPQATLEIRWKAQLRPAVPSGATAINRIRILEQGQTGVIGGSGHSGNAVGFTHLGAVWLPTTYLSYVGFSGLDTADVGFFLDFFPLNKKTQFELRGIQYQGAGYATVGGVSDSIGCLIGDCIGGFPGSAACLLGSGAISGGGLSGCKVERIPAKYDPTGWLGTAPTEPWNFVYKVTSNAPLLWQLLTHMDNCNQDRHTYAPASTLTYAGFMHYTWTADMWAGDSMVMMSTGLDPVGVPAPTQSTNVHMFRFNYGTNVWDYQRSYAIAPESAVVDYATSAADIAPWRIMSSDVALIINIGAYNLTTAGCCCCSGGDNHGAFVPTRETGYTVSKPGSPAAFYGVADPPGCSDVSVAVIGNVGTVTASYQVWQYDPDSTLGAANIPPLIRGSSGSWRYAGAGSVPPGIAAPANPDIHNRGSLFDRGASSVFRVNLLSGGPIQMLSGMDTQSSWAGGSVIHASDGNPMGSEFWMHAVIGRDPAGVGCPDSTYGITVFVPKKGMNIQTISELGYNATYTTNAPDEAVCFRHLTQPAIKNNYVITATGGKVIAEYTQCKFTEKGFTAPFLQSGVHYVIVAPPAVFSGQSFWITVVVVSAAGSTETDYCGTTTFTSTDPAAKIGVAGMATYDYTWSSLSGGCGSVPYDNGVKLFYNVTLQDLGLQTIVGSDLVDGSIMGLASIMVVGADIKLTKMPRLTVGASGDTVQFRICWSNYSSASAFTFVITDALPQGTAFVPEASTAAFDCGNTKGVPLTVAYSQATSVTPPAAFTTGNPTNAPSPTRWLRFTIPSTGVNTTGCVCYRVTVN